MIIGITGTLGAGKGTVVECLVKKHGFRHFSAREFLKMAVEKKGIPVNRDTLTQVANDLRDKHGSDFVARELYKEAEKRGENAIIESIRTVGEVEFLRAKKDFLLLAIDADPKIRYERISQRKSETDQISFERFLGNEQREMFSSNPNKQNLSYCIEKADFKIMNDGTIQELEKKIEDVFIRKIGDTSPTSQLV